MTDIICPLCGRPNPPDLDQCKYCQAPLKTGGFIAPPEGEDELNKEDSSSSATGEEESKPAAPETSSNLEQSIPDWLKETEASFLKPTEGEPPVGAPEEPTPDQLSDQIDSLLNPPSASPSSREPAIDDEWLANLLAEASAGAPDQEATSEESIQVQASESEATPELEAQPDVEEPNEEEQASQSLPVEKPEWLTNLEASSTIKMAGIIPADEPEPEEAVADESNEKAEEEQPTPPDWLTKAVSEETTPSSNEAEPPIAPAELPTWLEALRPKEAVSPTGPVEDVSSADIVTAGPLVGLRGVISSRPSAIRARKPPTYSIQLRVTDDQQSRVEMMQELLADEEKPTPLPSQPIISSKNIFRLIVAVALLLPMVWMIISGSQRTSTPQPGNIPGVVDFAQQVQMLPSGAPVLMAFNYEAGFSGEMNVAISNVISQLVNKKAYLTLVATTPSGPPLAESIINDVYSNQVGNIGSYSNVADLGYIPGGTMGLLGLATSPRSILPYSLNGYNVWAGAPLNTISSIKDFSAVIVMTNDPDTARIWIEQIGPQLQEAGTPLLIVTSSQAEPLIRPYYEASPPQVQGMIAGLAGGVAYGRTVGNIQQNGVWDAYSVGITVSILILLIGSIVGGVFLMLASEKKKEN
jgi:hypothetical protein